MADEYKRRVERMGKLLEKAKELNAQMYDVVAEALKIGAGEESIGDVVRKISAMWLEEWGKAYPGKYQWNGAVDAKAAKPLARDFTIEELRDRACRYLCDGDPYYGTRRHPFALFARNINQYAPAATVAASRPVDCRHNPACRSDQDHTARRTREMREAFEPRG